MRTAKTEFQGVSMGNVENVRKVMQDFVVPDLTALEARLVTLDKETKAGFEHAERLNLERFRRWKKLPLQGTRR